MVETRISHGLICIADKTGSRGIIHMGKRWEMNLWLALRRLNHRCRGMCILLPSQNFLTTRCCRWCFVGDWTWGRTKRAVDADDACCSFCYFSLMHCRRWEMERRSLDVDSARCSIGRRSMSCFRRRAILFFVELLTRQLGGVLAAWRRGAFRTLLRQLAGWAVATTWYLDQSRTNNSGTRAHTSTSFHEYGRRRRLRFSFSRPWAELAQWPFALGHDRVGQSGD
jgi:hypothetical protein